MCSKEKINSNDLNEHISGHFDPHFRFLAKNFASESQYEIEVSNEKFDYWAVRDTFLELMQKLLHNYQNYIRIGTQSEQLVYNEVFDSLAFIKSKSSYKAAAFFERFMSTSMFSKFIENRVSGDNKKYELYYNFFDWLATKKRSSKAPSLVGIEMLSSNQEFECQAINFSDYNRKTKEIPLKHLFKQIIHLLIFFETFT